MKCIEIRYDQFIRVIGFTPSVLRASSVHFLFSVFGCAATPHPPVSFLLGMWLIRRLLHELRHVQVRGLSICELRWEQEDNQHSSEAVSPI